METLYLEGFGPEEGSIAEFTGDCTIVDGQIDYVWSCDELDIRDSEGNWECSLGPVSCGIAKRMIKNFKVVA